MKAPQIIMIVLLAMSVAMALCKDGESKGNYSFGATLIATAIQVALLKWGGFF